MSEILHGSGSAKRHVLGNSLSLDLLLLIVENTSTTTLWNRITVSRYKVVIYVAGAVLQKKQDFSTLHLQQ